MRRAVSIAFLSLGILAILSATYSAQQSPAPAAVDFARDVQPIFQQFCYDCHGPDKQMNGFRLDRRHDAMRGGTAVVIGRGSAASSRLYLRLIGGTYGRRMPLEADPLSARDVDVIKRWIDQGAEWPDALSGDVTPPPLDPEAVTAFDALRRGDRAAFVTAIEGTSRLSTLRGPGGATPLMAAALYGDAPLVGALLERGADPNVANDAGATPLMWALADLAKTRLLLDRGADVNARSADGRVPLVIAASIRGNSDVLRLLLDRGANPSVQSPAAIGGSLSAITEAAKQGDEPAIRLLIERGSDVARAGFPALAFAIRSECAGCIDAIGAKLPPPLLNAAMTLAAPPLGGAIVTPALLARGADPNARNLLGFPILVLAAGADTVPLDAVRALIDKGADLSALGPNGESALTVAKRHGHTPMVDLLVRAGATDPFPPAPRVTFAPAASPEVAVRRSLPLLQRSDVQFLDKAGCVSCHNNTQTAHTVAMARSRGFALDEAVAARQRA
ncbi:MAG TPA: ankyrin repeat domain-containing protein, partial [Vicinamibacterales bacterium]